MLFPGTSVSCSGSVCIAFIDSRYFRRIGKTGFFFGRLLTIFRFSLIINMTSNMSCSELLI